MNPVLLFLDDAEGSYSEIGGPIYEKYAKKSVFTTLLSFLDFLSRFFRFIGWQDSLVQKMSSKFRVELEIFTVLCQTRLFGKREKKRARTPTRACRVWLPFFDSLEYAYSVQTHNAPLFSL